MQDQKTVPFELELLTGLSLDMSKYSASKIFICVSYKNFSLAVSNLDGSSVS